MACCAIIVVLLSLYMATAVSGQVATITALPTGPFDVPLNIATGSVVQLFCTADSSDAVFTWDRSGTVLTNDPPHTRIRSNSDASSTTSILTVDDFQAADSGVYQCSAGGATATTQMLTAFTPANPDDTLFMFRQPRDRESQTIGVGQPLDNRTALALGGNTETPNTYGATRLLRCVAFHTNDADQPLGIFDWTVNGRVLSDGDNGGRITIIPVVFGTRYGADLMITAFEVSDAGIYQCIAMDAPSSDSDIFLGLPFRFDTDIAIGGNFSVLRLERVSPEEILLTPPNKLVIEVKASGRYEEITWSKDGMPFGDEGDPGVFVVDRPNELPNFAEIFVRGETTSTDAGTYTVALTAFDAGTQTIGPVSLQFTVVATVAPNTTADGPTMVTVNETESVNISCTSTGLPTPGIQWTVGGVAARFEQINTAVQAVGSTPGSVTSVLQIVSAVPNDIGTYTCTGSNSVDGVQVGDSSDSIVVMVNEANPIAPVAAALQPDPVNLGALIELACVATNGTPPLTFTWTRDSNGMEVFSSAISGVYSFTVASDNTGSYTCNISNPVGSDATSVTVVLGVAPTVSTNQSPIVSVVVGANLMLAVDVTGFNQPLTAVTWRRGATELTNATARVTIINSDLSISPATSMLTDSPVVSPSADEGHYTVTAESPAGTSDVLFVVDIFAPPTIIDPQDDVTVDEGAMTSLRCTARGFPAPSFVWLQGTTELIDGLPRITIVTPTFETEVEGFRVVTSTLEISAANHSDAGSYACVASNNEPGVLNGEDRSNFTITVNFIRGIVEGPVDTVVQAPDPLSLTCTASGVPQPDVTWTKTMRDSSTVLYTTSADNVNITNAYIGVNVTSTLMICPTDQNFTANYTCRASNFIGSTSESSQAQVIIAVAPEITTRPENVTVVQPATSTFTCMATGRPRPVITWFFEDSDGNRTEVVAMDGVFTLPVPFGETVVQISLTFDRTAPNVAGVYVCVAENILDTTEASAVLTVHVTPVKLFPADNGFTYMANVTESVTFFCNATGIPPPSIQWLRSGMLLDGNAAMGLNSRVVLSEPMQGLFTIEGEGDVFLVERTITVDPVALEDDGTFTCSATNVADTDSQDFQLFVQVPPLVVAAVQTIPTNESNTETLNFRVDNARPDVVIGDQTWYYSRDFADSPFGSDAVNITSQSENTPGSTLTFSSLLNNEISLTITNIVQGRSEGEPTDAGRYFLVAVNPAGLNFNYTDLVVLGIPMIRAAPQDSVTIDGQDAVFICSALASPEHNIFWEFTPEEGNTTNIINTSGMSNSAKYSIGRSRSDTQLFGQLTVNNVQFADRGNYRCTAENDLGAVNAAASLTVHVRPVINQTSDSATVRLEDIAGVSCLATGYPLPEITWQKDAQDFQLGTRVQILSFAVVNISGGGMAPAVAGVDSGEVLALGELGVVSVVMFTRVLREDTANYTCNATNSLPETGVLSAVSAPISLTVLERPDRPENVTVSEFTARTVTLQWVPGFNRNSQVVNFSVYQRNFTFVNNSDFNLILTLDPSQLTVTSGVYNFVIADTILPFRSYSFNVDACNAIGCSEQSTATEIVITLQDRPDAAPTIVQSFSPNSTSLFLSWSSPPAEQQNGIITGYRVCYTNVETDVKVIIFGEVTETDVTLTSLEPFTVYNVEIAAGTFVGFGPVAAAVVRTLRDPPEGSLTAFFQLRLRPVGNCVVWTGSDREGKFAAIITEVARVVRESCFCNFTSANVIANVFSCITSTDDVVFKAELMYADTVSADELVQVISQWADGMPSIIYEGTLLFVDPTCPTELESFSVPDCVAPSQPSITAIAAGVTIGVIGVLLIAIAVIVVTLLALRRRRSQSHQFTPAQQAAVYEDVSGIQLKPVEPEVFQNLAYGHVKHPAAARAQLPAAPINGTTQDEEDKEDHTYEYI